MKKFNFKLERLLMIREFVEMEKKLKCANELQKKLIIEKENNQMKKSILESILYDYTSSLEKGKIDYALLEYQENYVTSLQTKIKSNDEKKEKIEENLTKLQKELAQASKEKKVLDELKKKEHKDYQKEIKKRENKYIDEIAGQLEERLKQR